MNATLFDTEPYVSNSPVDAPRRGRRPLAMSPTVWLALLSLKATLDSIPDGELEARHALYRRSLGESARRS